MNGNIMKTVLRLVKRTGLMQWCVASLFFIFVILPMSCEIDPPLHLPMEEVEVEVPVVIQELDVVWDIDVSWMQRWYYGWDATDSTLWGEISYPMPTNYEVRRYFLGDVPSVSHTEVDGFTIWEPKFRRKFNFGYYDVLVWSNIDSEDGTQVVVINESDLDNVIASTTTRATSFSNGAKFGYRHYNQPEIFYSCIERNLYISKDTADYDYYDPVENMWIKTIDATLTPLVYVYLVQVVLHNNNGRITGLSENCAVNGLASTTNVTTGYTGENDASVLFGMRLKKALNVMDGKVADVIGGKLTTYGLCGMPPYNATRGRIYSGTRADVHNTFSLNISFSNEMDSTYVYDVTDQFQEQSHGGVITLEIDVDTLTIPINTTPKSGGSGFDPYVEDYKDSVIHEISM